MKIAVLHWRSSSVGGINTCLQVYRAVAEKRGDTFHVLACDNQPSKRPELFPERRRVRGGDSFIVIDGSAPHHANNYRETLAMLDGYDVVMLSYLCPHPTKDYGDVPAFLPLLRGIRKPIVGYIRDAYWSTYQEFGEQVLPLCDQVLVAQKAYGEPLVKRGYPVTPVYLPFFPLGPKPKAEREFRRVVWMPQWKNIKGVYPFFEGLAKLRALGLSTRLYNNGIEYYKLRLTKEWRERVGPDHFAEEYSGAGEAEFFGCLPLEELGTIFAGAGFAVDFQGHRAKYDAYLNGSYNNTIVEALYYGAVPVVHENMYKSEIPRELLLGVGNLAAYPEAIAFYPAKDYPRRRAREFVEDHHNAERLYERIFHHYRTAR